MRKSFPSSLLLLPPTCCTKRTVHIRTVRFSVPSRTCGKPPFLRKTSAPAVSFVSFLQEKKSFPYPFLSRKKKTVGLRGKRSPLDGRTLAHPALSSVGIPQRVCLPPPPCLCPCPPRLRASFPVQTDHAKESQLRNSFPSSLLLLSPMRYTKRTVHIRTVRFSVPSRTCGKPPFLRKTSAPAVSFVSFLQEKKSFPYPFLSRKKRKKRKSIAEQLSFFAPAASANVLHKTDGSYVNRPFFRSK